jgi:hypothetical protein
MASMHPDLRHYSRLYIKQWMAQKSQSLRRYSIILAVAIR